jgi:hypothetical protein
LNDGFRIVEKENLGDFVAVLAQADERPAMAEERAKVEAVLSEVGCTVQEVDFEAGDDVFDVHDVDCGDGSEIDFKLDAEFKIIEGERPVTPDEKVKIDAAFAAEGCSGGIAQYDHEERRFEVDDVDCDGQPYDVELDEAFQIVEKENI